VQVLFLAIPGSIGYIAAGKLRGLAVTTATRSDALPDIPTIGAPVNTPARIIETLNREINAALADPTTRTRIAQLGGVPMPMTIAEFGKYVADETEKWGKVIRTANIKPE
jgi:tripartite-type tricarboxylate transporter receptor subunit TctC